MIMCAGMLAVMLAESGAFLLIGLVMELAGLAMFIGGMWQQKKIRDAQQAALAKEALAQADTEADDTAQPDAGAAPQADGAETAQPAKAGEEPAETNADE